MKKCFLVNIILLLAVSACREERGKFHINGQITDAKDTMLYLEHLTLDKGAVPLDSVKLSEEGNFSFRGTPIGNPEFYRLRIGEQLINLSVDSTETITVRASLPTMSLDYTVEGSGNCDTIRLLNKELYRLGAETQRIANDRSLTVYEREEMIKAKVKEYKNLIKLNYIQNRYEKASSYFAMFQMYGGEMVFDPVNDASDVTWFSAIANAWMENWPERPRTENLCNIALRGHRNTRKKVIEVSLDDDRVSEIGIIDMAFPDINGNERHLSELKGNVVLLDFTAYGMQNSNERIMALRTIYKRYHAQGLEIYQVSLDPDEHYWKTMCRQLPWVCVWDKEGADNDIVRIYNLQQIPTWFIIDRNNDLVGRQEFLDDMETEIQKLL